MISMSNVLLNSVGLNCCFVDDHVSKIMYYKSNYIFQNTKYFLCVHFGFYVSFRPHSTPEIMLMNIIYVKNWSAKVFLSFSKVQFQFFVINFSVIIFYFQLRSFKFSKFSSRVSSWYHPKQKFQSFTLIIRLPIGAPGMYPKNIQNQSKKREMAALFKNSEGLKINTKKNMSQMSEEDLDFLIKMVQRIWNHQEITRKNFIYHNWCWI